jgi:hypothetical protein
MLSGVMRNKSIAASSGSYFFFGSGGNFVAS